MTTRKDFPEEATEEPRILSPEEDARRAERRAEVSETLEGADEVASLADPDSPLRIPGELSPKPREQVRQQRRQAHGADRDLRRRR